MLKIDFLRIFWQIIPVLPSTVKSHILLHYPIFSICGYRDMPKLIETLFFFALKSLPLYPKTRFLLHAIQSENSCNYFKGMSLFKSINFGNSLIRAWSMEWACRNLLLKALPAFLIRACPKIYFRMKEHDFIKTRL